VLDQLYERRPAASLPHEWVFCRSIPTAWPGPPLGQAAPGTLAGMKDEDVIHQIDELAAEERNLHEKAAAGNALTDKERSRERDIDIHLDVLWDLLRQRRALRGAGKNPDDAVQRGPSTVEGYRQ
jgi:hypothetical protein